MDGQTVSAAQGTSTASDTQEENSTPSRALLGKIRTKLGGLSRDAIELQCREPIHETAQAAIELGQRLLLLKEMTTYGDWLPKLKLLGINDRTASRMMACAVRFSDLPEYDRLISAAQSKSKLFTLLVLDDDELIRLNQGKAVRGVSLTTLPETSVHVLRSILRDNAPGKANKIPFDGLDSAAPMIGNVEESQIQPPVLSSRLLATGDRVESLHAKRLGRVVKVYDDGSACICWDDGVPQPEGLGHERVPRALLIVIEDIAQADESGFIPGQPVWGEADANYSTSSNFEDPADYPAVYALLPGDFNGQPVSLIRYQGLTWLLASEVVALVASSPADVGEIETLLAEWHARDLLPGSLQKIRLASLDLVVLVIDQDAVEMLDIRLKTDASAALAAWCDDFDKPATVVPIETAARKMTLDEGLTKLQYQHGLIARMLDKVYAQVHGIQSIAEAAESQGGKADVSSLAEIASDIIEDYFEQMEDIDVTMGEIRNRLFVSPQENDVMPESVWLKLLVTFNERYDAYFDNDSAWHLTRLATSVRAYAHSPEVAQAYEQLLAFAELRGAHLYDHAPTNTVAYTRATKRPHAPAH